MPRLVAAGHEVTGMTRNESKETMIRVLVVAPDVARGQITSIGTIVNPDKLTHLGPVADYRSLRR